MQLHLPFERRTVGLKPRPMRRTNQFRPRHDRRMVEDHEPIEECDCGRGPIRITTGVCRDCSWQDGWSAATSEAISAMRSIGRPCSIYELAIELGRTERTMWRTVKMLIAADRISRSPHAGEDECGGGVLTYYTLRGT